MKRKILTKNKTTSAAGERRALLGYIPQYRICAEITYEALSKGRLEWLQLINNEAGQIDDFLIASAIRLDAYQVKHGEEAHPYTLNSLLKAHTGTGSIPLFKQLASGWLQLKANHPDRSTHVHLGCV